MAQAQKPKKRKYPAYGELTRCGLTLWGGSATTTTPATDPNFRESQSFQSLMLLIEALGNKAIAYTPLTSSCRVGGSGTFTQRMTTIQEEPERVDELRKIFDTLFPEEPAKN